MGVPPGGLETHVPDERPLDRHLNMSVIQGSSCGTCGGGGGERLHFTVDG